MSALKYWIENGRCSSQVAHSEYIPAMKSLPVSTAQVQMLYMHVNETRPNVIDEIE